MSSEDSGGGGGGERKGVGLRAGLSKQDEVEDVEPEEDTSPSSEASDATIVPNTKEESSAVDTSPEHSTTTTTAQKPPPPLCTIAPSEGGEAEVLPPPENSSPTQTSKTKQLVRSRAFCEDASPPPPPAAEEFTILTVDPSLVKTATLQVSPTPSRSLSRHKLSKDSSQGSTVSENGTSPGLSRDSSIDYTDSTGTDLELFLKNTLNSKQHKDRQMLLKLEREMIEFIKDTKSQLLKFPQMTSYHRMLVHRVAAFFGLDHNVDQSGKSVIVNRTSNTRLPDFKFRDHILDECIPDDQPKRLILKRDTQSHSFEEGRSADRLGLDKKSKSFEERVEEYDKARARIFNQPESHCHLTQPQPQEQPQQILLESPMSMRVPGRKEELHGRPWSSTDSSGYSTDSGRHGGITKASSFSGVTVLSRGDSSSSTRGGGLSATDSMSSGMSSLSSPMTRPPCIPSSPPLNAEESPTHFIMQQQQQQQEVCLPAFPSFTSEHGQPMAIWVATCLDKIPPGSVIINPQTCQPYTCGDGSYYRWPAAHSPKPVHNPNAAATAEPRSYSLDSSSDSLSTSFTSMGMGDGSDQQQQQQQQQQQAVYMMPHSTPHCSQPQHTPIPPGAGGTPMAAPPPPAMQFYPPVSGVRYMFSPGDGSGLMYGHYAPATPCYTDQQTQQQQQHYYTTAPTDLHQQQQQQQVFPQQQQPQQQQPQQQTPPHQQPVFTSPPQQPQQPPQPRPPHPQAYALSYSTYPQPVSTGYLPQTALVTQQQQPQQRGATPPAGHIKVFSIPHDQQQQQQQQRGHTPDREQQQQPPVLLHKAMAAPALLPPPHRPPQPRHPVDMSSRLMGHPLQQISAPRPLMQIPTHRMTAPNTGSITPANLPPPAAPHSSKTHRARKAWSKGSSSSSTDTAPPPPPNQQTGQVEGGASSDLIIPTPSSSSSSSSPSPSHAEQRN